MQNDQYGNQSANTQTQADKEWTEFERDLDTLGRQLAALQVHTASLGTHLVSSLEARFNEVKSRAMAFKQARETELEQVRLTAQRQADSAFADARARSTEAARQVWEKAEPLRQGAKDVGEGLSRAWTELRASFGKAAARMQNESGSPQNGPVPATSDDRHERT
jgi:hypothetical protein